MKKTLIALMSLCGVVSAASVGYNSMSESQQKDVVFAWDFSGGSTDLAVGSITMGGSGWSSDAFTLTKENHATVGSEGTCPWTSQLTGVGESFTLSLDVHSMSDSSNWKTIVSLYSDNGTTQFNNCMALTTNGADDGSIVIQSGLGNQTAYGNAGNRTVASGLKASDVENTSFTIVSDAKSKTLTLYVNGVEANHIDNWTAGSGRSLALTGFQFGSCFSNCDTISAAEISNITVWNKALSATEVSALIVPEPTTATLSLLALAGLAARRRRK